MSRVLTDKVALALELLIEMFNSLRPRTNWNCINTKFVAQFARKELNIFSISFFCSEAAKKQGKG